MAQRSNLKLQWPRAAAAHAPECKTKACWLSFFGLAIEAFGEEEAHQE